VNLKAFVVMFVRRYGKEAFFIPLEGSTLRGPITGHPHVDEAER
jgi:hypothetical protein